MMEQDITLRLKTISTKSLVDQRRQELQQKFNIVSPHGSLYVILCFSTLGLEPSGMSGDSLQLRPGSTPNFQLVPIAQVRCCSSDVGGPTNTSETFRKIMKCGTKFVQEFQLLSV